MRRLEAGLVVAVATLTVMATASVLTAELPSAGRVDGMIRSGLNSMVRWMRAEPADSPAVSGTGRNASTGPETPASSVDKGGPVTGSGTNEGATSVPGLAGTTVAVDATSSGATGAGGATGDDTGGLGALPGDGTEQAGAAVWSTADIQELESILTRAAGQMQPTDLQRLAGDLLSGDTARAQSDFAAWAQAHLSNADLAWIAAHFQGARAFDGSDVVLLQQAASQLWSELTPDEQALVASRVGGWLFPSGATREGSGPQVSLGTAAASGPSVLTGSHPE
ncbi:hypothetical protein [Alicyclobacillus macrosporangiidus]|uniref:hypothetical protein n=1 Tax=Alicyclobacillus macrosporangiidus TaxID=392015 RepID=UPI000494E99F|nr:hypothetical protein [Alicyclobacillus macrosporangiidus]